jgi:hypothetical protein
VWEVESGEAERAVSTEYDRGCEQRQRPAASQSISESKKAHIATLNATALFTRFHAEVEDGQTKPRCCKNANSLRRKGKERCLKTMVRRKCTVLLVAKTRVTQQLVFFFFSIRTLTMLASSARRAFRPLTLRVASSAGRCCHGVDKGKMLWRRVKNSVITFGSGLFSSS